MDEQEARRIMSVLGKAEGEFAASLIVPIYWVIQEEGARVRARNGTAFFVDAGEGPFGVTASHVLEGWREDSRTNRIRSLQLSDLAFELEGRHRIIAEHPGMDLATFHITAEEVRSLGKTVLAGYQSE